MCYTYKIAPIFLKVVWYVFYISFTWMNVVYFVLFNIWLTIICINKLECFLWPLFLRTAMVCTVCFPDFIHIFLIA